MWLFEFFADCFVETSLAFNHNVGLQYYPNAVAVNRLKAREYEDHHTTPTVGDTSKKVTLCGPETTGGLRRKFVYRVPTAAFGARSSPRKALDVIRTTGRVGALDTQGRERESMRYEA